MTYFIIHFTYLIIVLCDISKMVVMTKVDMHEYTNVSFMSPAHLQRLFN